MIDELETEDDAEEERREREPDPRNVQEYARWKRECEERQRPTRSKLSLAFSDADITRYHAVQT